MTMTAHYVRKEHTESTQLDGEWIILNADAVTITRLNAVGGFCWSLLDKEQTLDSLIEAVCEQFESISGTVEEDIATFLSELIQCGLLKDAS
jgi:hypothetical protein